MGKQKSKKEQKRDILDNETLQYYRRISHELHQDFDDEESKGNWKENLLLQFLPAHVMFFTDNYAKFPTRPLIICVIRTCKLRKGTGMSFMANSGSNMCRLHKTTHVLEWVKTLVYIFTDKENLIDNLTYQVPVGKSDHCCHHHHHHHTFIVNKLSKTQLNMWQRIIER